MTIASISITLEPSLSFCRLGGSAGGYGLSGVVVFVCGCEVGAEAREEEEGGTTPSGGDKLKSMS